MKTFKDFMMEAHLINTDPHDHYEIDKTDKMGPSTTRFINKKTGIHVTLTHIGRDQHGRPVHTAAWHHPESEGRKDELSPGERVRIGLHGVRAFRDTLQRVPKNSIIHASPTPDEDDKKNTTNTRGGIYRRMGMGDVVIDKDTGEHNQYGHITKKGKMSPIHAHDIEVYPEVRRDTERSERSDGRSPGHSSSAADRKDHEREMRRLDALERRKARGG